MAFFNILAEIFPPLMHSPTTFWLTSSCKAITFFPYFQSFLCAVPIRFSAGSTRCRESAVHTGSSRNPHPLSQTPLHLKEDNSRHPPYSILCLCSRNSSTRSLSACPGQTVPYPFSPLASCLPFCSSGSSIRSSCAPARIQQ